MHQSKGLHLKIGKKYFKRKSKVCFKHASISRLAKIIIPILYLCPSIMSICKLGTAAAMEL